MVEHGKEVYKKYPFLYITGNNLGASDDNIRPGDHAGPRTSTISEVASSTGSLFSDLSYSRCEDDLTLTETNCGKTWKSEQY